MKKHFDINTKFWLSIKLIVLLCPTLLLCYIVALKVDRINCYDRFSSEFDVPSNFDAIYTMLHLDLKSKVQTGLSYEETIIKLNSNWNNEINWRRKNFEGGFSEYVRINYCFFSNNDFTFLFIYSKDNTLLDISKYIDD